MENKKKASSITNIGKRLLLIFAPFISQTLEAIFAFSGVKEKPPALLLHITKTKNSGEKEDYNFQEVQV